LVFNIHVGVIHELPLHNYIAQVKTFSKAFRVEVK